MQKYFSVVTVKAALSHVVSHLKLPLLTQLPAASGTKIDINLKIAISESFFFGEKTD